MPGMRSKIQALLNAADFPAEIISGVPVVEIHGETEALVIGHRGIVSYSPKRVVIASALGPVAVSGADLTVYRMNRERILLHGTVRAVTVGEGVCG